MIRPPRSAPAPPKPMTVPAGMDLLRFATAGMSMTASPHLIVRCCMHKSLFTDQLEAVEAVSAARRRVHQPGVAHRRLRAEREQGLTIDVAYRYVAPRAQFIIADTPGTSSSPATWSPARPPPTWP